MNAMNFSGILSRKAERMNKQSMQPASATADVDVAVMEQPAPAPRKVAQELRESAEPAQVVADAPASMSAQPKRVAKRKPAAKTAAKSAAKSAKANSADAAPATNPAKPAITMVQYSERSYALFGDTKPIKDRLKAIGGRYNPNLHPFGRNASVPGWVFPLKCKGELDGIINNQ